MLMLKSYVKLYSHGIWENTNTNAYPWVSSLPQMYKRLSMGIKINPNIFQNVMSKLVQACPRYGIC
jgi:hypothetical protein